jgi:aspartyl-tRNA(Asn)/glutamyl-tRNA(Gln) amidotransferase subunit A
VTELLQRSATDLAALVRAGELSARELVETSLRRIDELQPTINAFTYVAHEDALAAADAIAPGDARPFAGVPIAIKDNRPVAGMPLTMGSDVFGDFVADHDAFLVRRLREAGFVIVGKTSMPEMGILPTTEPRRFGPTRNPWNTERTPGGSSGGAAAAVACGLGPLALGTDGAGSIRIPASFCGIVGLKPTQGRVPVYPPSAFGTLSHFGPMARTVADAALLLDVIGAPDPRDSLALDRCVPGDLEAARVSGLRVAYSPALGYAQVDPEVAAAVQAVVSALESCGARVTVADPGFASPVATLNVLWYAGAAAIVDDIPAERRNLVDPGLAEVASEGRGYSALDYVRALRERAALGAAMGAFHESYDLLVTPTEPIVAFAAGTEVPAGSADPRWPSWTPFTYPFNLSHQPAATVPCGFSAAGLPIGVQVVGARHADSLVLSACAAIEAALPWRDRWPEVRPA